MIDSQRQVEVGFSITPVDPKSHFHGGAVTDPIFLPSTRREHPIKVLLHETYTDNHGLDETSSASSTQSIHAPEYSGHLTTLIPPHPHDGMTRNFHRRWVPLQRNVSCDGRSSGSSPPVPASASSPPASAPLFRLCTSPPALCPLLPFLT